MTSRTQQAFFIAALISTCGLQSLSGEPAIFWVTNNSSDDTVANSLPAILAEVPPESEGEIPIIKFNLPADQHVIELTETLGIWKTVIIDGTSQTGYQGKPIIEITAGTPSDSQSNPWEFHGLDLMEPNAEIKGLSITGFTGGGIHINTTNCKIQSCFIGLRPDGRTARGNQIGLWVNGNDTQIGGKSTPNRNIISGNHSTGIYLSSDNNSVYGNYIGTDCDGNSGVGNGHIPISLDEFYSNSGIEVNGSSNRIGGIAAGEANLIKGNLWNGVTVIGGTKNTIRGNQFIANQQLAIDLAADSSIPGFFPSGNFITINDDLDGDSGPNDLLNMPRLDYAYETDDLLVIIATYRGEPSDLTKRPLLTENQSQA